MLSLRCKSLIGILQKLKSLMRILKSVQFLQYMWEQCCPYDKIVQGYIISDEFSENPRINWFRWCCFYRRCDADMYKVGNSFVRKAQAGVTLSATKKGEVLLYMLACSWCIDDWLLSIQLQFQSMLCGFYLCVSVANFLTLRHKFSNHDQRGPIGWKL